MSPYDVPGPWLQPWVATVGPASGSTVSWVFFTHLAVDSRHLAALAG